MTNVLLRRDLFKQGLRFGGSILGSMGFSPCLRAQEVMLLDGQSVEGADNSRIKNREGTIVSDAFPSHPTELVREVVTVAHFNLNRVKELVSSRPSLARAAWDWGFGDWETPLGAASHMGNRPIAEYLLLQGAPPSLFSAAMLGQLGVVKNLVAAEPGVQRLRGPHSISLLGHARMGGEAARPVYEMLKSLGDADDEAAVPLSPDSVTAIVGNYIFGIGINQRVEVDADMKMYGNKMYTHAPQLNWVRQGMMPRPLFHLGNRTFFPAGAPAVRIEFAQDSDTTVMTVRDGDLILSAARNG